MNRNLFEAFNFKTHCRKQRSKTKPAENKISWGTDLTEVVVALNEEVSCRQIIHYIWQLLVVIYEHTNYIFHFFLAEKLCVKAGHQITQEDQQEYYPCFVCLKVQKQGKWEIKKISLMCIERRHQKPSLESLKNNVGLKNTVEGRFSVSRMVFLCFFFKNSFLLVLLLLFLKRRSVAEETQGWHPEGSVKAAKLLLPSSTAVIFCTYCSESYH